MASTACRNLSCSLEWRFGIGKINEKSQLDADVVNNEQNEEAWESTAWGTSGENVFWNIPDVSKLFSTAMRSNVKPVLVAKWLEVAVLTRDEFERMSGAVGFGDERWWLPWPARCSFKSIIRSPTLTASEPLIWPLRSFEFPKHLAKQCKKDIRCVLVLTQPEM